MGSESKLPPFILASQSSARRSLLEEAGVAFMAVASNVDEDAIKRPYIKKNSTAEALALELARAKAETVSQQYPYSFVLGADQILDCAGTFLDKPKSISEARDHLSGLRGRSHRLVNGLVVVKGGEIQWSHTAIATLYMRDFSDAFLDDYLKRSGDILLSSVGAYRLEALGGQLFDRIEGDYFTVLGLPLLPLLSFLRHIHILQD